MIGDFLHHHVDPSDSPGELPFGAIMPLAFAFDAQPPTRRDGLRLPELVAPVGCNIAWRIVDAVLYRAGSVFRRNQRIHG